MSDATRETETPCHRHYFYVGGVYVKDETSRFGGCTMKDQTYVECLTPLGGSKRDFPLIFVHGGGQSGLVCNVTAVKLGS